ncbi:MAG: M20 family metallo-hydrolase [Gemmatimonadota bacterium]|nr:M20 family metallo-hydrolase [Gemmatimonadota bacterium]MDE3126574.1 M20 family metallo-hydrolase [Gemmatimonadota bacterium]MDE3173231.1 M20 family metallo-hydrolase [Gemmatimonadota bacterium]
MAALARVGRDPRGGVSRLAYGDADREARALVSAWMREAGLAVSVDAAGNIVGRREGADPAVPPLLCGSHVDSVPNGGDFDGPLGTLAAIEAAHTLLERGAAMRHPIEVVVWSNEEGGLCGSRAVSGQLPAFELNNVAAGGMTIADGIRAIGGDPGRIEQARRAPGSIAGYLELHIEQGRILEDAGVDIGVVLGIVAIHQWEVTISGETNHSGTTPMAQRHDALLAAAGFVELVHRVVTGEPGAQVGTVGRLEASPGAPNAIAGRVVCSLELRDLDAAVIGRLFRRIEAGARGIGDATATAFAFAPVMATVPAPSDPRLRRAIAEAARALGCTTRDLPSGAGHDAQCLAPLGPIGMIFVPSVGGVSHSPAEWSTPEAVRNGANVLLNALLAADRLLP